MWKMVCNNPECELNGIVYEVQSDPAECGGCNTMIDRESND